MMKMQKTLMAVYCSCIAAALLIVLAFEAGLLPDGVMADDKNAEFAVASAMELVTIVSIPVALRLLKFGFVRKRISSRRQAFGWVLLRMVVLALLMVANTVLYYLFMNVAFGYMGIILFLCMFFITPTKDRWLKEFGENE